MPTGKITRDRYILFVIVEGKEQEFKRYPSIIELAKAQNTDRRTIQKLMSGKVKKHRAQHLNMIRIEKIQVPIKA